MLTQVAIYLFVINLKADCACIMRCSIGCKFGEFLESVSWNKRWILEDNGSKVNWSIELHGPVSVLFYFCS